MKKSRVNFHLNQSGIVLTTVMIMLLVMSIIISAVVFLSVGNLNKSTQTSDRIETYYIAEGGINYLTQSVITQYDNAIKTTSTTFFNSFNTLLADYPVGNKFILPFTNNGGKTSQALVWIEDFGKVGITQSFKLHSEGYIGNVKRTLTKIIQISYTSGGLNFQDAVFSKGNIALGKSVIDGSLRTNSVTPGAIDFKNGGSVEKVYVPSVLPVGVTPTSIINSTSPIEGGDAGVIQQDAPDIKDVDIIDTPTPLVKIPTTTYTKTGGTTKYTIIDSTGSFLVNAGTTATGTDLSLLNLNGRIDLSTYPDKTSFTMPKFLVTSNTTTVAPNFAINIGSNDYTIVTNVLWITQPLKITGTGTLTILVKEKINSTTAYSTSNPLSTNPIPIRITSTGFIGNTNTTSTKLLIYVQKILDYQSKPITVSLGTGQYYLSLFSENLNFTLNSVNVHGAIATNGLALSLTPSNNSNAMLIYAPKATVTLQSSSVTFYGAIVCEKFTLSNVNAAVSPTLIFKEIVNDYVIPGVISVTGLESKPVTTLAKSPTTE